MLLIDFDDYDTGAAVFTRLLATTSTSATATAATAGISSASNCIIGS
jgi:hypothetical protein